MISRTLRLVSVVPLSPVAVITCWLSNELTEELKTEILPNNFTSRLSRVSLSGSKLGLFVKLIMTLNGTWEPKISTS